jgi:Protein of unknown function (DUF3093)
VSTTTVRFRERLAPPLWMWALLVLVVVSFGLVWLVVLGPTWSLWLTVAAVVVGIPALYRTGTTVRVAGGELHAGRAHIPVDVLGRTLALDADRAAYARGPGIERDAFFVLRGWVPTAVLVEVMDPEDPTPYWYVSTRRPAALVRALEAARSTRA